jgi:dipeptidyl aminopeptidase/acylaminoacyl peptidase
MQRDIRGTAFYCEAEDFYRATFQPGSGLIADAAEVSAHGSRAVFTGTLAETLTGTPPTRICMTELTTSVTRVLTFGPRCDRLPKFDPSGTCIAFLSDRRKAGDFQLYLLDPVNGAARATPLVDGWVEYLHWSPDGARILLGVAGHGADTASNQGAVASNGNVNDVASWMPTVGAGDESHCWRHIWVYELAANSVRKVCEANTNVWEAVWCGNHALAAVTSPGTTEGLWYSARLEILNIQSGTSRMIYDPQDQLGCPSASASGEWLAVVEAICSDRGLVAGDLLVIHVASGKTRRVDTLGVDVSYTEWRSDGLLLLSGHRGFETVVSVYNVEAGTVTEIWASRELTASGSYATVSGLDATGDCVLLAESFLRAPQLSTIRAGKFEVVRSFDLRITQGEDALESVECVNWQAPDGQEIQGWLLRPLAEQPYPIIMNVHGGPVWHSHPVWLGRRSAHFMMLLRRGYAIFFPNPRGSSGRGRDFVRQVYGDLGGADAKDLLSGLDALVARGIADPKRLGVIGLSYGGFMAAWLITQDVRFAAAVPVGPHTNQVSEHLLSNIPQFMRLLIGDNYNNANGKYFQRSPIMYADRVETPTLSICGALDCCTPPEEARQFHSALLENGVESVLITYPEEGHGVRKWPAIIDYAARVGAWFHEHMPAEGSTKANAELR